MSDIIPFLKLATSWQQRARTNQKAHYLVAEQLRKKNYQLGLPVVILSAIVGTSVFATLTQDLAVGSRVIVASVSIIVAILSSLQTFFRFSEPAEQGQALLFVADRQFQAAGRGQAANVIFESSRLPPTAFGLRAPLGGD